MLTDEDELVFVSAIKAGDMLLDPRDQRWKHAVSIDDGIKTTDIYKGGMNSVEHDPYREIFLEEVDPPPQPKQTIFPMSNRRPDSLYYNDIERILIRKKGPGGELRTCRPFDGDGAG
jgi:hypothetical protein